MPEHWIKMKKERNCGLWMDGVVCISECVCTHALVHQVIWRPLLEHCIVMATSCWYSTVQMKFNSIMIKNGYALCVPPVPTQWMLHCTLHVLDLDCAVCRIYTLDRISQRPLILLSAFKWVRNEIRVRPFVWTLDARWLSQRLRHTLRLQSEVASIQSQICLVLYAVMPFINLLLDLFGHLIFFLLCFCWASYYDMLGWHVSGNVDVTMSFVLMHTLRARWNVHSIAVGHNVNVQQKLPAKLSMQFMWRLQTVLCFRLPDLSMMQ